MKILSLLVVLLAFFRETSHQFPIFVPHLSLSLANEEFIEPVPIVEASADPSKHENPTTVSPTIHDIIEPLTPHSSIKKSTLDERVPAKSAEGTTISQDSQPVILSQGGDRLEAVPPTTEQKVAEDNNQNVISSSPELAEKSVTNGSQQFSPGPIVIEKKGEDVDEPIPSYMEWAQKKQQELITNTGQNGHSGTPGNGQGSHNQNGQNVHSSQTLRNTSASSSSSNGIDAKNFASPDCGSKVVQYNQGSQNPSGVLSSSHDEYMLNRCGTSIWFVVELCEPLTIERISVGNLELFSSSPKEVEFGISDRYPTRDWVKLGPFTLPDSRSIHPVVLPPTNSSMFGKFVKVSVLSHYGSEHYCPVSVIRVNGKSEYEVLESETTHQEDVDKDESALFEEPIEFETTEAQGKVTGLKDTVLNMINKAVQSIVRGGSPSDPQASNDSYQLLTSKCRSVLQCVPRMPMDQEIYKLLSCNSTKLLPFLASHSPWCGWDYCHATFESRSIGLPWQPEGFFASLFGGPSVLHALCHYLKPMTEGCDPTCWSMNHTVHENGSVSGTQQGEFGNESLTDNINVTLADFPINTDSEVHVPPSPSRESQSEDERVQVKNVGGNPGTTSNPHEQQIDQPPINPTTSVSSSQPSSGNLIPPSQQQQQQETQIPPPVPVPVDDPTAASQLNQAGGNQPQQKESVFVRLTNRIKNLERNQSLTASYLEELSKRFKKQNEDSNIIVESNKRTLNETRIKLLQLDDFYRQELQSMRRNMEDVRERLFNVQLQRSLLVIICLAETIILVGVLLWIKKRFRQLQTQLNSVLTPIVETRELSQVTQERRRDSDPIIKREPLSLKNDPEGRPIIIRKRSNSYTMPTEKSKKIRKRNKKQLIIRGVNSTDNLKQPAKCQDSQLAKFHSSSGEKIFDLPFSAPHTPKENIDPQFQINPLSQYPKSKSLSNSINNSPIFQTSKPQTIPLPPPSTLLTKVDSPFTFGQHTSPFVDSGISTSSRFALLASPSRESTSLFGNREKIFASVTNPSIPSAAVYQQSGSTESSVSSTSIHSETLSQGRSSSAWKGIFNGHHSTESGKKGKKVGLKSLMPKLFDR